MDFSKFLDEDFDVKEWVNAAFRSQKEGTKDQHATTLVMKLQMFIQEVNNVIEDSCQQTITNLPRVMRELEAVRQEAALLQDQMKMIKHDIQKVEYDTAQSMQMLLQFDSIKSRMMAASGALKEADNWTTLSGDVDEVYESGDVNAIANKLVGMQQSLQMLTDVPDYAERCQFLETLKNRLEAMLSPQVVQAFSAQSLESAQMYVKIFGDIDRLPQLNKYYHKCQKGALLDEWRKIHSENGDKTLVAKLSQFYDQLLSTWHTQMQWCSQVFPDPVPIVCELVTETLTSIEPTIPACIATHLQSVDTPLDALIELKQASERFAQSLQSAIATHPLGSTHSNYSTRLATTLYSPYKPYIRQYKSFEESTLTAALDNIPLDAEDILDTVNLLAESVPRLFAAASQANERCCQLTNGCGYVGLVSAIQVYLGSYQKEFGRVLVNMREKCSLGEATVDSEDWDLFQQALRAIQIVGDILLHTEELDQKLVSSLVTTVGKYCPPTPTHESPSRQDLSRSAFEDYRGLLLDSYDERRGLEATITRLEEGDTPSLLEEVQQELCGLSALVHRLAFDIAFTPLQLQIAAVSTMEIWTSGSGKDALTSDLPTFSLTPQEYITKIGNYMMTVPQQLEAFSLEDNPALIAAVKHGKLPFCAERAELPEHLADLWLESVSKGTMHSYIEQILRIPELSVHATKQLITDIKYMFNVLDDLGLQPSDTFSEIVSLLEATEEDYSDVSDNTPQRLASAIANMRKLSLD